MKNCVISFANSKGNYINRLARLSESLRNNSEGIDFVSFIGEASLGCELHSKNPYSFKVEAFYKMFQAGYKNVLWLDSSVFAIKPIHKVFDDIENKGFCFQRAGHMVGSWANDYTLNYFGITRDEAMDMPMIGNAGLLGLSVTNKIGVDFFAMWSKAMLAGCFKGNWTNEGNTESNDERCLGHRHDMSSHSIVANKLGLINDAYDGDKVLQYAGIYDETLNDTIIFKAQG